MKLVGLVVTARLPPTLTIQVRIPPKPTIFSARVIDKNKIEPKETGVGPLKKIKASLGNRPTLMLTISSFKGLPEMCGWWRDEVTNFNYSEVLELDVANQKANFKLPKFMSRNEMLKRHRPTSTSTMISSGGFRDHLNRVLMLARSIVHLKLFVFKISLQKLLASVGLFIVISNRF